MADDDPGNGGRHGRPMPISMVVAAIRPPPPNMPVVPALEPLEPKLSVTLARAVDEMRNPHPNLGTGYLVLPAAVRREAEMALARYDQLAQPAGLGRIADWLGGVNAGMAQPLPKAELTSRAAVIANSLRDMPAGVFNAGTRRDAQIAFAWFPGVKDVHDFLHPYALPVVSKRHALQRLLEAKEPPAGTQIGLEERQRIADDFQVRMEAVKAERIVHDPAPSAPPPEVKPSYLTRAQLRETYRQLAAHPVPDAASRARLRLRVMGEDAPEPVPREEPVQETEDVENPW